MKEGDEVSKGKEGRKKKNKESESSTCARRGSE